MNGMEYLTGSESETSENSYSESSSASYTGESSSSEEVNISFVDFTSTIDITYPLTT